MIGATGVGKTSLVKRFVQGMFSEKYLSTIGVKIDSKTIDVPGGAVRLLVWDLEGLDDFHRGPASYTVGATGLFLVVDGTRRRTLNDVVTATSTLEATLGGVPRVIVFNKADLEKQWDVHDSDIDALRASGHFAIRGSAKTGLGVEEAFRELASRIVERGSRPPQ